MKSPSRLYWLLIAIAFIVLIDEWVKFRALLTFPSESDLVNPSFFNLAVHKNFGLAFDLPFRLEFVIAISAVIGIILLHTAWKNRIIRPDIAFSCLTIVIGALGNVYDRIVYGFTVDYLIFFGRSALNLSDLIIIFGILTLLHVSSKKKSFDKSPQ